jgi:hypothetical protein
VKDRLRDLRSIVRQHRHDTPAGVNTMKAKDQPFPVRQIEGFLGHAASAFDDVMTLAETLAPPVGAVKTPVTGPRPQQAYFPARADARLEGERAFRRDLYRLARLALDRKGLRDVRILEGDFAAVHEFLEKNDAELIALLHGEADEEERVSTVARLTASLFVQLARQEPVKPAAAIPGAEGASDIDRDAALAALAVIAIAAGLATLDMEGAPAPELMEIAILAVDARGDRIRAALDGENPLGELTALFESLLTHLN